MKNKNKSLIFVVVLVMVGLSVAPLINNNAEGESRAGPDGYLKAVKTDTAPTLDGQLYEAEWAQAETLNVFVSGGEAGSITVELKALYDDNKIYVAMSWPDDTNDDLLRQPWVFDSEQGKWFVTARDMDEIHQDYYEDKFGILWNIDNSIAGFNDNGCQVVCHIGAESYKATNADGELGDMWHWKLVRSGTMGQIDDKYLNNVMGDDGGRHGDTKTAGGYSKNKQTLNNGTADVTVPKYWIPNSGGTNEFYLFQSKIDSGEAKLITTVAANNSLQDEDGNWVPTWKWIPGLIIAPAEGSRGDISAAHSYTMPEGRYTVEFSRALTTATPDQDVQFDDMNDDYYFSVAIFDNTGIIHSYSTDVFALEFVEPVAPNPAPTGVSFTVTADLEAGDTATFTAAATDTDALTYAWDFGDGNTGTGASADNTYADAGAYLVTLTVTDTGANSVTYTKAVYVAPAEVPPPADTSAPKALGFGVAGKLKESPSSLKVYFDEPVTITEAKLDGAAITLTANADKTIYTYTPTDKLKDGDHTFSVTAKDGSDNTMSSAASTTFTIDSSVKEKDGPGFGAVGAVAAVAVGLLLLSRRKRE